MKKEIRKSRVIRPIATVGFTYMITLLAVCHLPLMLSAFLFLFCLTISFLIAVIKPIRNQRGLLILLTAGIACGAHFVYTYFNYNPALKLDGKSVSMLAKVEEVSTSQSGKSVLTVSLDRSVVSTPVPVKAKLYLDEPGDFRPADWIRGVAFFYLPSQEYGTSSPTQSAKADGVYLYASAKTMELSVARPNSFQLSSWLYDLRLALKEKANALFQGESAAVFQGMLLGNNDEVSNKTYRDFVHTGILHVMVVSGLHLVIVSQFVIRTLKAFRIKRKLR
ncbi:MAG: ComEC/Rec2 family competence protein, partial [Oscillospiraceae bacterium]|nr:ComEC/Rec2 family competence protein [Oscillospiraceae bacterium]